METSSLDYISEIDEFVAENKFLDDADFSDALNMVVKCILKPTIPPAHAIPAIVQMQAYAAKFKMQAQYYMVLEPGKAGTDNNKRKNLYFAMADCCDKLAAALKYSV